MFRPTPPIYAWGFSQSRDHPSALPGGRGWGTMGTGDAPEIPGALLSLVPLPTSCLPLPPPSSPPTCSAQINAHPSPIFRSCP